MGFQCGIDKELGADIGNIQVHATYTNNQPRRKI